MRRNRILAAVAALLVAAAPAAVAGRHWATRDHSFHHDPLEAGVWLDSGAPRTGEHVTGVRDIAGVAQAPEGTLRIELFVVRAGDAYAAPLATLTPLVPLGEIPFAFQWDTRGLPAGLVEVRVVATSLLRQVAAAVPGVEVGDVTDASVPVDRIPAPLAPLPRAPAVRPRPVDRTLGVYVGPFDRVLPYQAPVAPLHDVTRAVPAAAAVPDGFPAGTGRDPWVPAAAGLLLLVTTAHVHRVLRGPRPKDVT